MSAPTEPTDLAKAIQDVAEYSQKLVHEEIELAKAEITEKVTKLVKGVAVGAAAGVFAFFALIYALESLAWGLWKAVGSGNNYWLGFLLVTVILLVFAAIAGLLAFKFVKGGRPAGAPDGHRRGPEDPRLAQARSQLLMPERTPAEIRASMDANRRELTLAVDRLRHEVTEVTDWRKHIRRNQKQVLIGAAVAGFVVGGGVAGFLGLFKR